MSPGYLTPSEPLRRSHFAVGSFLAHFIVSDHSPVSGLLSLLPRHSRSFRSTAGRATERQGGRPVRSLVRHPTQRSSERTLAAMRIAPAAARTARTLLSLSALCLSACAHCAPTEQARQLKKRRSTASFPLPPQQSHQSPAKRACEKCRAGASDDHWLRTQNRTSAAVTSECTMSQVQPSPSSAVVDHRHRRRC